MVCGSRYQDGSFVINKSTNLRIGTPELYISSGGNIGIGSGNSNSKTDVNGRTELNTVNVSGISTFVGTADFNGDVDVDGLDNVNVTELDNVNVSGVSTFVGTNC